MKTLRVATVQIRCHPYITIGARSYSSEPLIIDGDPLLSRLSESCDVSLLRHECQSIYDNFHRNRLRAILAWLTTTWGLDAQPSDPSRRVSHLVLFPEGAISHSQLDIIIDSFIEPARKKGHFVTVIAGTHSFVSSKRGYEEYPEHVWYQDRNPYIIPSDAKPLDGLPPPEVPALLDAATDSSSGTSPDWESQKKAEMSRILNAPGYGIKSILPVLHHDSTTTLRIKELLSPSERTNLSKLSASIDSREQPKIVRTHADSYDRHAVKILPLVCSEALQSPDNLRSAEVLAICSYHHRPEDFDPLVTIARNNGKLPVVAVDGAFGGSGIFLQPDRRAENWWFGKANRGKLPPTEAIVLVDADMDDLIPQTARWNPDNQNGLFRISAIVPFDFRDRRFEVSFELKRIADAYDDQPDDDKIRAILDRLDEFPGATPVQSLKIRRLWDLHNVRNLTRQDVDQLCHDCVITHQ